MQTRLRWLVLALSMLGSATFASAQETGSISGYTFDATGTAVAGVTVTVTGAQLPGARTVTSNDSGFFQVPILLPGSYTVKAAKTGVGDSQRTVIVEVSRDSQVDLALGVALQESVAVTAATPARRPAVDRGELQLLQGPDRSAAAAADLRRPVPADPRRRREQQLRPERRRQPPGQHLPARRGQHHQPRLRLPVDRGQRVRHPGVLGQARRHHRGVRARLGLRHERRHPQRTRTRCPAAPGSR